MNPIKAAVCGLLLSTHLVYSGLALTDTSIPKARGTITLMDKDKHQCSLDVPEPGKSITYSFYPGAGRCENDKARDIEVNEVPSATEILLTDNGDCTQDSKHEFWFKFRTTKKQTTTDYIELEYLKSYTAGQIIRPGLQLVDKWVKQANPIIRDKLSCVKITTSAAPPASQGSVAPAQP